MAEGWHVDKRVPLALIFAIFVQSVAAVWWAATATSRIDYLEMRTEDSSDRVQRLIRLEVDIQTLKQTVNKIDRKLDQLTEK